MGSPQTGAESAVSKPADSQTAASGLESAATAAESAVSAVETAASSEVAELKAKLAALELRVESFVSSIREGLHNRVNELENTIKRKFPYV